MAWQEQVPVNTDIKIIVNHKMILPEFDDKANIINNVKIKV